MPIMQCNYPTSLALAIDAEIAASSRPWRSRREYILDSISDKLAHDKGYRERAENKRKERLDSASTD